MNTKNKKVMCSDIYGNERIVDSQKLSFRPSVYGVLIENNKILLSKQWDGYDFPGGGIEIYETIEEALKREFLEETGIEIEMIKPIACETSFFHPAHSKKYNNQYWNCPLMYFSVKKIGGNILNYQLSNEELNYADKPEWISLDQIHKIKFYNAVDSAKIIELASVM